MTTTHIDVRDARDRLIDLLGIGRTYPLTDLTVRDDQLTVPYNSSARIPIQASQRGVVYQLYDRSGQALSDSAGKPIETAGDDTEILLDTPPVPDDVGFRIKAVKSHSGKTAYLNETADVKVGLNKTLTARIEAPLLTPAEDTAAARAARIVFYAQTVTVTVEKSQEGVYYRLVYFQQTTADQDKPEEIVLSEQDVRGDLSDIELPSKPVLEDLDIRIRAIKKFDVSENRPDQTELLEIILPLKVRANPALQISLEPQPVVDYHGRATLKLAASQKSVHYQLYVRSIPDSDFDQAGDAATDVLQIPLPGKPTVRVRTPPRAPFWQTPQGYQATAAAQTGNDGELTFQTGPLTADSLIIVQAAKQHQITDNDPVASAIRLEQTVALLVRPNPLAPLRLRLPVDHTATLGLLLAFGGQPGVFY
jgi:hypothetical protein